MKIAYLSFDFGVPVFGTGGSSVHVREVVRALRSLGHEVPVFSPAAEEGPSPLEDVHALPLRGPALEVVELLRNEQAALPEHLFREWRRLLYAEYAQRELLPVLRAFAPDVIYERYSLFSYAGVELARALDAPLILEVNAPLAREAATHRELVLRSTAEELERRVLCAADALVVVSNALVDHARSLGVDEARIEVLPNAVDPDRFHAGVSGEAVRARYGLEDKRVVGFVGSLKPWHDLETLARAAELLYSEDARYHLLVVGDGPGMKSLRARDASWLTTAGSVAHEDVPSHVAAMDAVVVPLTEDASEYFSPVKLYEAMAMAKPVVAANAGQIGELAVDGETALLYRPGDANDLAAKLRDVFDRPAAGAAIGAAARRYVLEERTWDGNARRVMEIAASLLSRRP